MNADEFALSFVNEITKEKDDVKKSFRARARDLYSMAYSDGIIPMLAYAYSKAKEKNIMKILEGIKEIGIKEEDKSYALYAVAIIRYLKEVENIREIDGKIDSLINKIKENEDLLTNKILAFMNWLKLFSEAKIEIE
ncbi:MAG: type III-B CRISPR module-associated protein Cmr5 [Candidatus Methanomethylicia archaeon]